MILYSNSCIIDNRNVVVVAPQRSLRISQLHARQSEFEEEDRMSFVNPLTCKVESLHLYLNLGILSTGVAAPHENL